MLMLAVIKVMPMALSRSIQPPCSASTYNMLSMFRLITGALQTIFQFAILDYAWLPYDGLLSVPVYAVRALLSHPNDESRHQRRRQTGTNAGRPTG